MAVWVLSGRGQVTLPIIILISGVIIEIAVAGTFIAYFLSTGGLGERLSTRAETAALSGIYDTMIKITRDKDFLLVEGCANVLTLNIGSDTADIVTCMARDNPANTFIYTINSTGKASNREKKFTGTIVVDQTTGKVQLKSIVESPVS